MGGKVYFLVSMGSMGDTQLWETNGTEAGTRMVATAPRGSTGGQSPPMAIDGVLYFDVFQPFIEDGVLWSESQAWSWDGHSATADPFYTQGTSIVEPNKYVGFGSRLFFIGDYTLWESAGPGHPPEELSSAVDETEVNTGYLWRAGGTLFLAGYDPSHGDELWKLDTTDTAIVGLETSLKSSGVGTRRPLLSVRIRASERVRGFAEGRVVVVKPGGRKTSIDLDRGTADEDTRRAQSLRLDVTGKARRRLLRAKNVPGAHLRGIVRLRVLDEAGNDARKKLKARLR
jgi:ELWxxDGT repeat protein